MFSRVASRLSPRWVLTSAVATSSAAYYLHTQQSKHVYTSAASSPSPTPTPSPAPAQLDQLTCLNTIQADKMQLVQLIYITRHGARTAFAYT